jgi:chaperonin GroEL
MSKIIIKNLSAREKIVGGVSKLADAVSATMGPQGKNVIIGKFVGAPVITKDGVSVAREIVLDDALEDLACQLVKEVAGRTADIAGDGTTTATVLVDEMVRRGSELMDTGYSPLKFKEGLSWTLDKIVGELNELSKPVENFGTLKSVASISSNNDFEMGGSIADAFELVGFNGTVSAEASPGAGYSVREIDGIELKSGYISPSFLEEGKSSIVMEKSSVLILNEKLTHLNECLPMLNELSNNNNPILIIAKSVKQEALNTLVANNNIGRLRVAAVEIPTFGKNQDEWLDDLSILLGTKIVGNNGVRLRDISIDDLGFASKIIVGKHSTRILEGSTLQAKKSAKLSQYKQDSEILISESDRKDIESRISFLNGRAAVITVGYSTELELREKGDRIDDALSATRAAIDEGYIAGGGVTLAKIANSIDLTSLSEDLHPAANVILGACFRPITQILSNGFLDPTEIIAKILSSKDVDFGYNAATNKYGDMIGFGVLDPKKVTRVALQNAASIALLLLNTDVMIAEKPEDPSSWQPPAGWRPPAKNNLNHKY